MLITQICPIFVFNIISSRRLIFVAFSQKRPTRAFVVFIRGKVSVSQAASDLNKLLRLFNGFLFLLICLGRSLLFFSKRFSELSLYSGSLLLRRFLSCGANYMVALFKPPNKRIFRCYFGV